TQYGRVGRGQPCGNGCGESGGRSARRRIDPVLTVTAPAESERFLSEITVNGQKRLVLVTGRAHPQLAADIASALDTQIVTTDARTFANGEIYARYDESVRGCDAFVIQSHTTPINEWLMEQLIMVDALKRASAKRITVVAPC